VPRPFSQGWRVFWTQQHGDNVTWELFPAAGVDVSPGHSDDKGAGSSR
jgi:hypothetical protein